ncbi:prepilin-type cleavage/methylation N-terminal domain protein [Leptospira ryugenii]|uniref:Prepilin-type cleavage/methylation N-terminal domain protein n=1 Tax=Leptospira ryugenii TaxID=1917863 RepID=A0A2P2DWR0_9LEPT|nr:prepilin-type N-terminal cleavage/methylation domain-containing protein [Leptospira ryugenii]GBF49075.1 prepilin-type cleavage/methylation N-terminal domain protein [Leptospira ryugenii]
MTASRGQLRRFGKFRSGLTLIELVIVVAVIGVMMAFLAGLLRNLWVPTSEDVALKLSEAFKFGSEKAQLLNQTVVFKYDFEKAEYRFFLLKREEDGLVEEPILRKTSLPFYAKIVKVRDFAGKVQYKGELKLFFSPQGTTTDCFLYLGNESEIKKTMQLFRYSGRIKVYPGEFLYEDEANQLPKVSYGLDERDEQVDQNTNSSKQTPRNR